jgi:hypothetical protein
MDLTKKADDSLEFIVKDCREAVSAMPENPRAVEYLQAASEAERILVSRNRLRGIRERSRGCLFDPLTVPIRQRRFVKHRNSGFSQSEHKTACFQIGWYRLYGLV